MVNKKKNERSLDAAICRLTRYLDETIAEIYLDLGNNRYQIIFIRNGKEAKVKKISRAEYEHIVGKENLHYEEYLERNKFIVSPRISNDRFREDRTIRPHIVPDLVR